MSHNNNCIEQPCRINDWLFLHINNTGDIVINTNNIEYMMPNKNKDFTDIYMKSKERITVACEFEVIEGLLI